MIDPPRLYLVDGSSYIFRAFFALPPLTNASGLPTQAVYGFTTMTLKFLKEHAPGYLAVVFDAGRRTFRNDLYQKYKENRPEAPTDLVRQFPYIRKVLAAMNVPTIELAGFEADDIIATLAKSFAAQRVDVVVVSGDKDLMQLVDESIKLFDSGKEQWVGVDEVKKKFGVEPQEVIEVVGLMGDSIDNIPGVKGIGQTTAMALIQRFHSLENLFANLDDLDSARIKGAARVRKALEEGREAAFLSRELAKARTDVPVQVPLEELRYRGAFDKERLRELFTELGFTKLLKTLEGNGLLNL